MAKRTKTLIGRPTGSESMVRNVPEEPAMWKKPCLKGGRWRVERVDRLNGRSTSITLTDPEGIDPQDLDQAIADRNRIAAEDKTRADLAALPPDKRPVQPVTLRQAVDEYMRWADEYGKVSPDTLAAYKGDLGRFVGVVGEGLPLLEVTTDHVEKFTERGTAGRSKEKLQSAVRRLFKFVRRFRKNWGVKMDHPIFDMEVPKSWRKEIAASLEETPAPLEPEQLATLLAACRDPYVIEVEVEGRRVRRTRTPPDDLLPAVALGTLAGLRKSNVWGKAAVTWGAIDLTPGAEAITLPGAAMKGRRPHAVPICGLLADILRKARATRRPKPGAEDRVVRRSMEDAWKSARERAGFPKTRFHDCRHTFGLLIGSANDTIFPFLMGHSKCGFVSKRYRHAVEAQAREVLAGIPNLLGDGSTENFQKNQKKPLKIQINSR